MTLHNALIAVVAIGLAMVIATGTFEVITFVGLKDTQAGQRTEQQALRVTQDQLVTTQNQLVTSENQQVQARVTTVGQRCALTEKLLTVLTARDPVVNDREWFHHSLAGCLKQLAKIQYEAAHPVRPVGKKKPKPKTARPGPV